MLSGTYESRSVGSNAGYHGVQGMIKVNVRIVFRDLFLPDFPCMPAELVSKFVDKMCTQFAMNKETIKFLTQGRQIEFNQPGFT